MPHLLRVDASSRLTGSTSRNLGDQFETLWRNRGTSFDVLHRDVVKIPLPSIEQKTITAFYTPPDQFTSELREATVLSNELIRELKAADELLLTTPMYNFCIPAALKAWIDQIVRINHTFAYDGKNFTGLLQMRRATIVTSYGAGGYLNSGSFASVDHCAPYLEFLLKFLGIEKVEHIGVEATTGDAELLTAQMSIAKQQIARLANN